MGIAAKSPDVALLGENEINVDAISFNGTSSYIEYANHLFRDVDLRYDQDQAMTISFWIKPDLGANETQRIIDIDNTSTSPFQEWRISLQTNASSQARLDFEWQEDNSNFWRALSNYNTDIVSGSWNHILYSIQIASNDATHQIAINDSVVTVNDNDAGSGIINLMDTSKNSIVGKQDGASNLYYDGCLSEFWMKDDYYNLSSQSNRRKFISSNSKPVELPASPLVYLKGTASSWANTGSSALGTQTLNNITDCADAPSD